MRREESEIKVEVTFGDKDLMECITNMLLCTCKEYFSTDIINNKVEKECIGSG